MKTDPRFTSLFWAVWRRNLRVYRRIWTINFLPPLLEPVFYLLAFGLGFSGLVTDVTWHGRPMDFISFFAPALVAAAAMWQAFMETTYNSFVRMYYQKSYDAMLATPLSLEEIIVAEIVWGATRSGIAAVLMLAVITPLDYAPSPQAILAIPIALLGGLAFACVGMAITSITATIDLFNLPVFLFITPMFLFSGTFFPTDALPPWAANLAAVLPLYHLVELTRAACLGQLQLADLGKAAVLVVCCAVFGPLALAGMRRRLIR
jgi:lipooligosaccharide transport system permease protein